jgi:hypothetical protein
MIILLLYYYLLYYTTIIIIIKSRPQTYSKFVSFFKYYACFPNIMLNQSFASLNAGGSSYSAIMSTLFVFNASSSALSLLTAVYASLTNM